MARKHPQLKGQQPLLTVTPAGREYPPFAIKTWKDMADSPEGRLEMLADDTIGPHSNLVERAERIIGVLDKISSRNSLGGFSHAVRRREHKKPIWERYLDGTPMVIRNAASKQERLDDEITADLLALSGFDKVKGLGLTRGEVRSKIEQNDDDFEALYGQKLKHSKARHDYRKVQLGFLPEDHPLKPPKKRRAPKQNPAANSGQSETAPAIDSHGLKQSRKILAMLRQNEQELRLAADAAERQRSERASAAVRDSLQPVE